MELNQLIDYDEWANRKVFVEIEKLPENKIRAEIYRLFSHLLGSQVVWFNRVVSSNAKTEVWPELSSSEIEKLLTENPDKLRSVVNRKNENVIYSNSTGKEFENTVEEVLMHLIIHGQHHRAQIATLLRKAGTTPPGTDLIFYLRNS